MFNDTQPRKPIGYWVSEQGRCMVDAYIYIYQWRRKVPKSVGGGGAHRHVIYVHSIKNQYKRAVFGYMVIY